MRYQTIDPSLFIQNRTNFSRQMKGDSLAIFNGNDFMPRNGDQFYMYRQQSDFFYLTGIDQPNSVLVLFPQSQNQDMQTILFIEKTSDHQTIWEGEKLSKTTASKISGIDKILWLDQKDIVLQDLIFQAKRIYINGNENIGPQNAIPSKDARQAKKLMSKYPYHKYHRAQTILRTQRMVKSPIEISLTRRAIDITRKAFEQIVKRTWIGNMEYELEGEITSVFIKSGSSGHAYHPIIASGGSACILHYTQNSRPCHDGDLILMDFGAEYANYAADLSRTIPVNGRYSQRQKEVYDAVLAIHDECRSLMVPGAQLQEINKEAGKIMSHKLYDLDLISRKEKELYGSENPPYRKYFMHGIAHHLGLDVHDLSDRFQPLQEGMVITCEPGIYIKEESLGVRIENNILVTDNGPIDLMHQVPIKALEIEDWMNSN